MRIPCVEKIVSIFVSGSAFPKFAAQNIFSVFCDAIAAEFRAPEGSTCTILTRQPRVFVLRSNFGKKLNPKPRVCSWIRRKNNIPSHFSLITLKLTRKKRLFVIVQNDIDDDSIHVRSESGIEFGHLHRNVDELFERFFS